MRTTRFQFEMLVGYMERNGDITKIKPNPLGKARMMVLWEELARILNNNGTGVLGPVRTIDQWKKVWSDFKNNIKRKAAYNKNFPDCSIEERVLAILNRGKPVNPGSYNESGDTEDNEAKPQQLDVEKAMDLLSNSDSDVEEISGDESARINYVDYSIQNFFTPDNMKMETSPNASSSRENNVPDIEIKQEKDTDCEDEEILDEIIEESSKTLRDNKSQIDNIKNDAIRKSNMKKIARTKNMRGNDADINDERPEHVNYNEFRGHKHVLPNIVPVIVRKPYRRNISLPIEKDNFTRNVPSQPESSNNKTNINTSEKSKMAKESTEKNIENNKGINECISREKDSDETDSLTIVTNENANENETSDNEPTDLNKNVSQNNISNQVGLRQLLLSKLQQKKNTGKKVEKKVMTQESVNESTTASDICVPPTTTKDANVVEQIPEEPDRNVAANKRKRTPLEPSTNRRTNTKKRKVYTMFIDNEREQRIFERDMAVRKLEIEKEEIKMKTKALEILERLLVMAERFFINSPS